MDKQKKQIIFIAIMAPLMLFLLVKNLAPKKKRAAASVKAASGQASPGGQREYGSAGTVEATSAEISFQEQRASMDWGRDPFTRSAIKELFNNASLELKGVSVGRDRDDYALINGEILKVGDDIFDYTVVKIERDKVLLQRGEESFYLALPQE